MAGTELKNRAVIPGAWNGERLQNHSSHVPAAGLWHFHNFDFMQSSNIPGGGGWGVGVIVPIWSMRKLKFRAVKECEATWLAGGIWLTC